MPVVEFLRFAGGHGNDPLEVLVVQDTLTNNFVPEFKYLGNDLRLLTICGVFSSVKIFSLFGNCVQTSLQVFSPRVKWMHTFVLFLQLTHSAFLILF